MQTVSYFKVQFISENKYGIQMYKSQMILLVQDGNVGRF